MQQRRIRLIIVSALLAAWAGSSAGATRSPVTIAPAPAGEPLSDEFEVNVEGQAVPVYRCRVSAVPLNQVWPGYQRPLDQTELASFAYWDMPGAAEVQVRSQRPVQTVAVRPSSLKIKPVITGNAITFRLPRPCVVTVEINGPHHALHLFASPPEKDAPRPADPGVRYFGPGVHRPGKIVLESNQTLYVAGGAVVYGAVHANGVSNVRVLGRGIIDASGFERGQGGGVVRFSDCSNVVIDGVVMRDPDVWCCSLFGCRDARIANVKLVGLWRYNADGIDLCNSRDITVRDCFVRAFDDCIVLKGLKWGHESYDDRPVQNVDVSGCVIWNDWGRALEIGAETCAPEIAQVTFRDCDIIRTVHIALDIQHGDRAAVRDIRFENIRVEIDDVTPAPRMQRAKDETYAPDPKSRYCPDLLVVHVTKTFYSQDDQRGSVRDVLFKDITVTGRRSPASRLQGLDAEHGIDRVVFENVRFNGQVVTSAAAAQISIGAHVRDVKFIGTEKPTMVVAGSFVHIYDPSVGEKEKWYINDHCFVHGPDGLWHLFGITHQEPAAPLQERIFAHASAKTLLQKPWDKQAPALAYAPEPPWHEEHLWAPHVIQHDGTYYMFYCAGAKDHSKYKVHLATSTDLRTWIRHPKNPVVVDGFDARDPFIMREPGKWMMYYTANSTPTGGHHVVKCVTSTNLLDWSDTKVVYTDPSQGTYGGPTESPFVVRRGTNYFLFIGPRPGYDGTDVLVSRDPFQWKIEDKVGHIPAHAAEVVRDADGKWYVSRCGWGRGGVYLAPLTWQDGHENPETNVPIPKKH